MRPRFSSDAAGTFLAGVDPRTPMARHRGPRAALKAKALPTNEPMTSEPSVTLRGPHTPVPSDDATRERLAELLALVDREGYRHPFLSSVSSDHWAQAVDELLERYRRATDPVDAAKHLGAACRRDPRLLASSIVLDQLIVWRLEVAEAAVRRNLVAARLSTDDARAEEERRKTGDCARAALRRFGQSLAEPQRQTHVATRVFLRVYGEVERSVQEAIVTA